MQARIFQESLTDRNTPQIKEKLTCIALFVWRKVFEHTHSEHALHSVSGKNRIAVPRNEERGKLRRLTKLSLVILKSLNRGKRRVHVTRPADVFSTNKRQRPAFEAQKVRLREHCTRAKPCAHKVRVKAAANVRALD
jgi:hypothetical protein